MTSWTTLCCVKYKFTFYVRRKQKHFDVFLVHFCFFLYLINVFTHFNTTRFWYFFFFFLSALHRVMYKYWGDNYALRLPRCQTSM